MKKKTRLQLTLEKIEDFTPPILVDAYNKKVYSDGASCTITTRVDASNHIYVIVEDFNQD